MIFETSKDKGRAGLSAGIAYFGMNGYTVLLPLNDTQDYDIVIEKDGVFKKVQCKSTGALNKNKTFYVVDLRSYGGANGGTYYGCVKDSSADLLFILTGNQEKYLIPVTDTLQKSAITLTDEYDKFKVSF